MINDIIIDVTNLTKLYKLYERPADRLKETLHPLKKSYHKDFYALNNITFQIHKGETVGIIGKNGAGKSTLLKIITGVLTPTSGNITVKGKIASLLELGTGFNPEYTGIENIYLNGFIMGYTRKEMDARLPTILDFADIGEFIHQPVKIYSSGMYVRLAFSVAINVEPDILIVDEALSVGDAKFQRKCFARLDSLKTKGTTILFVTHDMSTTKQLCTKAILLNDGCITSMGEPKDVVVAYYDLLFSKAENNPENQSSASQQEHKEKMPSTITIAPAKSATQCFGMGGADIDHITISNMKDFELAGGENIHVEINFHFDEEYLRKISDEESVENNLIVGFPLSDVKGTYIFGMTTYDKGVMLTEGVRGDGKCKVGFIFTMPYLKTGDYFFNCAIALGTQENHVQLKWYDGLVLFKINSSKKNVYGILYQEYSVTREEVDVDAKDT